MDVGHGLTCRLNTQVVYICMGANRIFKIRPKARNVIQLHSHGFKYRQQISEHDGSINPKYTLRVAGCFCRKFRRFEEIETLGFPFYLMILRHIASCLPIQPYWRKVSFFAPTRFEECRIVQGFVHS